MANCGKCGAELTAGRTSCDFCGEPAASPAAGISEASMSDSGLQENVAGLLCYDLGWVTGLIFLLIDKRPSVRFHAAQSIVVFGALQILYIVVSRLFVVPMYSAGQLIGQTASLLMDVLDLAGLVLWIVLMIKAYQGQKFRVPVAAELADNLAKQNF